MTTPGVAGNDPPEPPSAADVEGSVARIGGVSYLHIPAVNPRESAAFYHAVFDWTLRGDPDRPSFSDGTGHVIGSWVSDLPVAGAAGLTAYIYVAQVDETLRKVSAGGGEIVEGPYPEGGLWVATFRDPGGNVLGVWQQGPR
jgi:predicted enzyme related to lactoylglutathione lyase